jgi:hypothetical protein
MPTVHTHIRAPVRVCSSPMLPHTHFPHPSLEWAVGRQIRRAMAVGTESTWYQRRSTLVAASVWPIYSASSDCSHTAYQRMCQVRYSQILNARHTSLTAKPLMQSRCLAQEAVRWSSAHTVRCNQDSTTTTTTHQAPRRLYHTTYILPQPRLSDATQPNVNTEVMPSHSSASIPALHATSC